MRESHEDYMKRRMREDEAEYEDRKWEEYAQMLKRENEAAKIHESPDGGKTVYERSFGAPHTERTLVKPVEDLAVDDDWNGYDDGDFQEDDLPFEFDFEPDWKYNEEQLIQEFKDYVELTYDGHYSQNKYQATEIAIEAGHGTGFCMGNILKYAQRYGRKGTAANARKDLLKIMHYALIQLYIHDTES